MGRLTLHVARKELREAARDRRALLSGLFYGVWGPLVMALALTAVAQDRQDGAALTLLVGGGERAPALIAFLLERGVDVQRAHERTAEEVRTGRTQVVLAVAGDYDGDLEAATPASVTLIFDGSRVSSRRAADRARGLLAEYAARERDARLVLRGITPSAMTPLDVGERDLSTAASRASSALATMPMFVLLAVFVGGLGVAADVSAGERERASLESLLIAPASRRSLVAGKWIAILLVALVTLTLTLAMCHVVLRHPRVQAIDLPVGLSAVEAASMWGVLAPLAMLTAAVQLLIGFFARTYKEAQTHLSLLVFVPMIPGFLLAFGALQPAPWMTVTPVLGQHLMVSDLVRGLTLAPATVAALAAVSTSAAIVALAAAVRLIAREAILHRPGA